MLTSTKALGDIARLRDGTLADVPFPLLLTALADAQRTVVVRLTRGPLEKHIVLDGGIPIDCESNLLHESLGPLLVKQGKLQEADYQSALVTAAAEEKTLAEALLQHQLISSFELFRVMQQSLAQKLLDVFAWREGSFRIIADTPDVESPLRVNVGQLIMTGVLRFVPQSQVDAAVGALVGKTLAVHPEPPTPLSSLRLPTRHSRALQELRARLRVDELMAKAGMVPDEVTRLVVALALLGVVVPADELPAATAASQAPPPRVEPRPASVPVPAASTPSVDEKALREQVMSLYMRHRRGDAFDLLGVPITADAAQIVNAYLPLAELCAPWRFTSAELSPVAEKAEELFLALSRAYAELIDGEARARVVDRRKRAAAQPFKARSDVYKIKTSLLDAAAQFTEGIEHKEAGRYADALKLLEFAADCDAQNATYKAEAAHTRFLDSPNTQAKRALEELGEALRMDPQCAIAAFYTGQIFVAQGDLAGAKAAFSHALKLAPDDVKARRALRELG